VDDPAAGPQVVAVRVPHEVERVDVLIVGVVEDFLAALLARLVAGLEGAAGEAPRERVPFDAPAGRPLLTPQDLADAEAVDPAGPHLRLIRQVDVDLVLLGVDEQPDGWRVRRPLLAARDDKHPGALRDRGRDQCLDGPEAERDVKVRAPRVLGFPEPRVTVLRASGKPVGPPFRERPVLGVAGVAVLPELAADAALEPLAAAEHLVVAGLVLLGGKLAGGGDRHRLVCGSSTSSASSLL
jgi:hypothetical protein